MTTPQKIDLTFEQVKKLKSSISISNLNESDKVGCPDISAEIFRSTMQAYDFK